MPTEILRPVDWLTPTFTWPFGFVSNIDEPIGTPDGSSIATNVNGDFAYITLTDPVNITDASTITNVDIYVRVRATYNLVTPDPPPELWVGWLPGGVSQGFFKQTVFSSTYSTFIYSQPGWNDDWSLSELINAHIGIQCDFAGVDAFVMGIDVIEVRIDYTDPPPVIISPEDLSLSLSTKTPTRLVEYFRPTTVGAVALAPQAVELFRADSVYPDPDVLLLNKFAPTVNIAYKRAPAAGSATLASEANVLDYGTNVSDGSVALTGNAPVAVDSSITFVRPPVKKLYLLGDQPAIDGEHLPARGRTTIVGQGVTLDQTLDHFSDPSAVGVVLSSGTPVPNVGTINAPAAGSLTLATYPISQVVPVGTASVSLTGYTAEPILEYTILTIDGKAPMLNLTIPLSSGGLALNTGGVIVENASVHIETGSLVLSTGSPTLEYGTALLPGDPGLEHLSTRYDVEHIASPTDETII